jgi:hypothetical protein
MVNDRSYRLGEASTFKVRIGGSLSNPAIIFESSFLQVTQEFSFVRNAGAAQVNGVKMNLRLENRGGQPAQVGLRFLLDTNLGEGNNLDPFVTGRRTIKSEYTLESRGDEKWWVSRNNRLGLMGSVFSGDGVEPDVVHFANWKRLNEAPWRLQYVQGRNFNNLPYSINDSAVCYYFDPKPILVGESKNIAILLAAENDSGFTIPEDTRNADMLLIRDLVSRIDDHISGRTIIPENELTAMEQVLSELKARYGLR